MLRLKEVLLHPFPLFFLAFSSGSIQRVHLDRGSALLFSPSTVKSNILCYVETHNLPISVELTPETSGLHWLKLKVIAVCPLNTRNEHWCLKSKKNPNVDKAYTIRWRGRKIPKTNRNAILSAGKPYMHGTWWNLLCNKKEIWRIVSSEEEKEIPTCVRALSSGMLCSSLSWWL